MIKTKIETCDYTWSPVTGCWGPGGTAEKPNRCAYCYAKRIAMRFVPGDFYEGYDPFEPAFHPDRLSQPAKAKKPSKIFVCSMADLLGDWVPREQIEQVINAGPVRAPWHTYQFLTKNPKRLKDFIWPSNCWVGTTITNQADADERLPWLLQVDAPVLFVSHEPLLSSINVAPYLPPEYCPNCHNTGFPFIDCGNEHSGYDYRKKCECITQTYLDWAIIGGMAGPRAVRTKPEWVMDLADQYQSAGVPLFVKDNLGFTGQPQEWPK